MENIKVGGKLIASHIFIAAVAVAVGLFLMSWMTDLDDRDTYMCNKAVMPLGDLPELVMANQRLRINIRDIALAKDLYELSKYQKIVGELYDKIDEQVKRQKKDVLSADQIDKLDNIMKYAKKYTDGIDDFAEYVKKRIGSRDNSFYFDYYPKKLADLRVHSDKVQENLDAFIKEKANYGKQIADDNTASANKAKNISMAILAALLIASILIGIYMTFSVTNLLKKAIDATKEGKKGNMFSVNKSPKNVVDVVKEGEKGDVQMAKGMGCYFHPEEQSVGIKCKDHPSKQAEINCEKCGEPICEDCYSRYKFCYECTTDSLNDEIREYKNRGELEKNKRILVIIFSIIGLIIGAFIAVGGGWSDGSLIFLIWICVGIGGNFRVALSEFPSMYQFNRMGEDSFFKALGGTFAMAIFLLLLKSLAGPIIPFIKISEYTKNMRTAESTVADDTDLLKKLADYHAYTQYIEKHGSDMNLAKLTEQGGALYNNEYANAVLNGTQETYLGSK